MIARVLRRFAHLDDGLDVPWESPESCRDIGKLQLRCSFQKLLKELLVFAVKDRLLCAVVHVEDLEEDAEDDGNDDEVEHVGRLHLLLLLLPGQNGPNPVPICPKTPHPGAALPPQLSPRPDSRKGRSSSRACRVNFSNVAFLNRASLLLSLYHHQPLLLVSEVERGRNASGCRGFAWHCFQQQSGCNLKKWKKTVIAWNCRPAWQTPTGKRVRNHFQLTLKSSKFCRWS